MKYRPSRHYGKAVRVALPAVLQGFLDRLSVDNIALQLPVGRGQGLGAALRRLRLLQDGAVRNRDPAPGPGAVERDGGRVIGGSSGFAPQALHGPGNVERPWPDSHETFITGNVFIGMNVG